MTDTDFAELVVARGDRRVTWEYIGEGYEGDYDHNDPEDRPLLRFSCDRLNEHGEWEELPDGSYCTLMPTDSPREHLESAADRILDAIEGDTYKRELEYLSWLSPGEGRPL